MSNKRSTPRGVAWPFFARVEQARCDMAIPVTDLARISGVRRQTFLELRRTTRRPRLDIVIRLAEAVDLDVDLALQLAGLSPMDSSTVRDTIEHAADFSDQQRAALLAVLDSYRT